MNGNDEMKSIKYMDMHGDMSRPARNPTVWSLRKVSTRISLSMPRMLTRIYTFRLLCIFCFRNHYSISLSP